jgi:lipopolysaccharide/colanic/teichoic acid biosynthesis glycosyltransferase
VGEVTELALTKECVRYDYEYIHGWSFWQDIWISLKAAV